MPSLFPSAFRATSLIPVVVFFFSFMGAVGGKAKRVWCADVGGVF